MRYLSDKSIVFCLAMLAAGSAGATSIVDFIDEYKNVHANGTVMHLVDIDNDTLLLDRDDGFYTSGMRYTQRRSLRGNDRMTSFGWRIGQELYTASDIKLPPEFVGAPDHPYAGWLYGGIYREVHLSDGTYTRMGIDIGCLGPCAGGEWTQTQFHKVINQPSPRGWSKQVRNEAGVVLHGEIAPVRWVLEPSFDITPAFNARFGNIFTDAGASLLVRAGQLNILPSAPAFHAYLRTDVRAVAYNATLQGGYFSKNNPHTVDPKRFTGSAEAGVVLNRGAFGARLALVRRSNEIRDLPNSVGAQNYLHLQFSYTP
ncbi:lipid A deacylase LpxR family protein [Noviherbaspirillum sp. ST9]|uniref:lipid A deacylase LpxR family protein n=1 Tax=Noviherbaspirillum sp. ST9 TaxID=3401606 RepID=UPI003B589146